MMRTRTTSVEPDAIRVSRDHDGFMIECQECRGENLVRVRIRASDYALMTLARGVHNAIADMQRDIDRMRGAMSGNQ